MRRASPILRRRLGFSLVEVTVFMAVGVLVMAGAWSFFQSSIRKGKATDVKVESLQADLLFARSLERDLEALYEDPEHAMDIVRGPGELRFSFWRYGEESPGDRWDPLPVERVTYRFDASKKRIFRRVGNGREDRLYGLFERMNIRFRNFQAQAPGPPAVPSAAVIFSATSTPRETLQKPLEAREEQDRTTLFGAVLREREAVRTAFPWWNPIPYAPARP